MNAEREFTDPALDALLREHSTQTPPAAVDAAILAAAHRAVGSAPHAALATRAWRWWMPIAAAAVIGVIVIGVLPLAPTIVEETAPVVSDSPASGPRPQPRSDASSTIATPDDKAAAGAVLPRAEPPRQEVEPPRTAAKRERGNAAPPGPHTTAADARKDGAPISEAPAKNAGRELPLERKAPAAPPPAEMRKEQAGALGAAPQAGALRASPPAAAPMSPGTSASPQLASPPETSAQQDALSRDKRDDFGTRPHTADEWIARIRTLRREGRLPEAIRELAGFRAAFTEADALLPPDLREWANALTGASVRRD